MWSAEIPSTCYIFDGPVVYYFKTRETWLIWQALMHTSFDASSHQSKESFQVVILICDANFKNYPIVVIGFKPVHRNDNPIKNSEP